MLILCCFIFFPRGKPSPGKGREYTVAFLRLIQTWVVCSECDLLDLICRQTNMQMKGQSSCREKSWYWHSNNSSRGILGPTSPFMAVHFNDMFTDSTARLKDALKGPALPLCKYWKCRGKRGRSSEWLLYLLQVIELHGYLSEEEVDVRSPLHSADKIWLCVMGEREEMVRKGRKTRAQTYSKGCVCREKVWQTLMEHEKVYSKQCFRLWRYHSLPWHRGNVRPVRKRRRPCLISLHGERGFHTKQ